MIRQRQRARGASGGPQEPVINGNERIVATGGSMANSAYNGSPQAYTRCDRRSKIVIGRQPVKRLLIMYANVYRTTGNEINGPNSITVKCGLEKGDASQTVVGRSGNSFTLTGGGYTYVEFLPSMFGLSEFAANSTWFCRTGLTVVGGGWWPVDNIGQEQMSGTWSSIYYDGPDQIGNTGSLVTPANSGGFANLTNNSTTFSPLAILGEWSSTADVAMLMGGDSIPAYQVDTSWLANSSAGGYFRRGIASVSGGRIPFVNITIPGLTASEWAQGANTLRKLLMTFATHYHDDFGTNDVLGGRTYAQLLADKQLIYADFKARAKGSQKIVSTPIPPRTTGTFTTAGGQTPVAGFAVGGIRDQVNSQMVSLLGLTGGPDYIVDTNLDWENQSALSKWVDSSTTDGVHPITSFHVAGGTRVNTSALTWTP